MSADVQPGSVEVGPIASDQIPSFHRALDSVARERRFLAFLEAPPPHETRDFILGGIEKGHPRIVASCGGEILGWCDIGRHFIPTHAHRGSLGVGVVSAFRGKGLGLRLIRAALQAAWAADITRVELAVYADNAPAIALYEKVGFIREGIVRNAVRIDGRYRDAIAMALLVDDPH